MVITEPSNYLRFISLSANLCKPAVKKNKNLILLKYSISHLELYRRMQPNRRMVMTGYTVLRPRVNMHDVHALLIIVQDDAGQPEHDTVMLS